MHEIDLSNVSDLETKQEEMNEIELDELFKKATDYFNSGNIQLTKTAYFMFRVLRSFLVLV